jgi:hypothetical protein
MKAEDFKIEAKISSLEIKTSTIKGQLDKKISSLEASHWKGR